jgi:predicted GNAT family acetyltransferase
LTRSGFDHTRLEVWYVREPGPLPVATDPPELTIERVAGDDLAEFEAVSVRGFGGEGDSVPVGAIHPTNSDRRMTFWLGRVDGEAVCAAMSYETERAIGIFGVTTVAPARNRGYATALMRRALLLEREKPAVLNTDTPAAVRVYERLGFEPVGDCAVWTPGPVSRTNPDGVLT